MVRKEANLRCVGFIASKDGSNSNVKSASDISSSEVSNVTPSFDVIEDEVDKLLAQKDGQIQREMNAQLCRHSKSNKCVHCIPLDPWDETYLSERDPPIKVSRFAFICQGSIYGLLNSDLA